MVESFARSAAVCRTKESVVHGSIALSCGRSFPYYPMLNTLRPRQNRCHFADDIFKCIFLNENVWIPIKISSKFIPKGPINYIPALVQIMAWHRPGDKPLSETMMFSSATHICVARPQWVNSQRAAISKKIWSTSLNWIMWDDTWRQKNQ